jgi:hypothetical protein
MVFMSLIFRGELIGSPGLRDATKLSGRVRMLLLCTCCSVGECGCVYLLSTFSNVNVTMCVCHRDSMQLSVRSVCVYVSVAACICCSTRLCDRVSFFIKLHQVFPVSVVVCQNVFSCGFV